MSDHAVVHFEIGGPDGQALQDFYGKLFGWTINADNPMNYAMVFKMDNGIGGGLVKPQMGPAKNFVTVYATCGDDLAGVLAKAEGLGGKKVFDP
ncbi:MAG: VOC family protein, partial [Actinomycetota bacterium]